MYAFPRDVFFVRATTTFATQPLRIETYLSLSVMELGSALV